MAVSEIDTKEIEITIKGCLISTPTVIKANALLRDLESEIGKSFPFRRLGFQTFVDYLRSIPNVVQLQPYDGYNPDVYPIASQASRHIDQLVSRQRVPSTKKRGISRRGAFNSRPPPVRRRISRPVPPPVSRPGPSHPTVRPNQGLDVRDVDKYMRTNYDKRDLERNGIHNVDHLLSYADGMVERDRGDTKVFPKLAGESNDTKSSRCGNGIPAGLEDDFDDFDEEYEFYDDETERDSEEELSRQAIELWSKALGVQENSSSPRSSIPNENPAGNAVEDFQTKNYPEEDSHISSGMIDNFRKILSRFPDGIWASQLEKLYSGTFGVALDLSDLGHASAISLVSSLPKVFSFRREGHDWKLYDAQCVSQGSIDIQVNGTSLPSTDNERYIPQTIIENIKRLLEVHPNGFRSTDLLQLYMETFRKQLNLEILGFNTLDEFLMILKNDITLKKTSNYYLLLPKHQLISHDALQPPKPDEGLNKAVASLAVPMPDNVMRLGEEIPLQELPEVLMDPDPERPLLELEVRVAEVMSPVFFYVTLGSMHEELEKMMDDLDKYYKWEQDNFKIPLPHIVMNLYCVAKYLDYWHRAKITRIKSHGDIEIEYIDYGTPATVKSSELRYLSKEFIYLPAQAICAKLMGVKPLDGGPKFPHEVCKQFLSMVDGKRLVAHVYRVEERERMQLEVILFDVENPNQEIILNDHLIEQGLASPILELEETSENNETVGELLPESNSVFLPENCPSASLPNGSSSLQDFPLLHGDTATSLPVSSVTSLMKAWLASHSLPSTSPTPSPRITSLSLHPTKKTQEEKKPKGPPPGFEKIQTPEFDFSGSEVSAAPAPASQSSSRPSTSTTSMTEDQRKILINNYYLMNPAQLYPQLLMQEQYQQPNVFQPNPSNMPVAGFPLFQTNANQRSITFGSVVPPQNAYHNPQMNMYRQQEYRPVTPIPANYIPVMMQPAQPSFIHSQYLPCFPNMVSGQPVLVPQVVHSQRSPAPVPSPPPAMPHSVSSTPTYTPITVPQWPPKNLPPLFSTARAENKVSSEPYYSIPASAVISEKADSSQVPTRPSTPLTPASAEIANICKLSRPNSTDQQNSTSSMDTTSSKSENNSTSLDNNSNSGDNSSPCDTNCKSENNKSPLDNKSKSKDNASPLDNNSHSENNISPLDILSNKPEYIKGPVDNYTTNLENITSSLKSSIKSENNNNSIESHNNSEKIPNELQINMSILNNTSSDKVSHNLDIIPDSFTSSKGYREVHLNVNEIPLPADLKLSEIPLPSDVVAKASPLPTPSPDILFSAISSPVDSLIRSSPLKEESSDDYNSACENVEDAKKQMANLTLTTDFKKSCDTLDDIPDSWENLDLDDTPAKAENFSVDLRQPLDLILKNMENRSALKTIIPVQNSAKSQETPLKIEVPINWKEGFNPDNISDSERIDNNNKMKIKSQSHLKCNVQKIPLQEIELQGKSIHLLILKGTPAVLALEFFQQFSNNNAAVAEKVVEVSSYNKMYFISKTEYPAILTELSKKEAFGGGVSKRIVLRLNKVRVLNVSDIPPSLKALNVQNKPLLDDLKKIANELAFC